MPMVLSGIFTEGFLPSLVKNNGGSGASLAIVIAGILLCLAVGYLCGSFNFGLIISKKMYGDDVRKHGSGNAGSTNMMRTYGGKAAGLTLLGDALKAVVAVISGGLIMGVTLGGYAAALGCVLGHVFPVFYGFRGGKGVATAAAAILVLNPFVFLVVIAVFLLVVIFTRFVSLGSVLAAAIFPLLTFYTLFSHAPVPVGSGFAFFCSFAMALTVILKHHENLSRLAHGNESKFSFKKSKKSADQAEKPEK